MPELVSVALVLSTFMLGYYVGKIRGEKESQDLHNKLVEELNCFSREMTFLEYKEFLREHGVRR